MAKNQTKNIPAAKPASERLKELFDLLNIKIVYYVDDENNLSDFDVQIVIGEVQKIYGLGKENELSGMQMNDFQFRNPVIDLKKEWVGILYPVAIFTGPLFKTNLLRCFN